MIKIMFFIVCMLLFTACSSIKVRSISALDVSGNSFTPRVLNPLLEPEIETLGEVTGEAEGGRLFGIFEVGQTAKVNGFEWGDSIVGDFDTGNKVRNYATYKACQKRNAHFLIAPRYVLKKTIYPVYIGFKVKVTGIAARYKSFRNVPWGYETQRQKDIENNTRRSIQKYDFSELKKAEFGNLQPENINIILENN